MAAQPPEVKEVKEDKAAAATIKQQQVEEKRKADMIQVLESAYLNEQQGREKKISDEKRAQFEREVDEQLAKEAAEAKALADAKVAAYDSLSAPEKALQGAMSKVGEAFKGGPFAFIGTALEALSGLLIKLMPALKSLFPMLQNLAPMFNRGAVGHEEPPEETPMELVKNLTNEGRLDEANVLLIQQEKKLLQDMEKALEQCEAKASGESKNQLDDYCQKLKKLECDLEKLIPIKEQKVDNFQLEQHLKTVNEELKVLDEKHGALLELVTQNGDSLKDVPFIFKRIAPILEAHKLLYAEEAEAAKAVTPP